MLKEIYCSIFNKKIVSFHNGLNIILGDNNAKNSIGKSTALMVIDFVFGGNDLLEDKSGVIAEFGPHCYNFCFKFSNNEYYYSRSTESSNVINICNEKYEIISKISINNFKDFLKEKYNLTNYESSFRNIISPFSRIWGKDNINPDTPFSSFASEAFNKAITRLIDIFSCSLLISSQKSNIDELVSKRNLLSKSMKAEIIPNINKKKYKENSKLIEINNDLISRIKQGLGGAVSVYDSLYDSELNELQINKNKKLILRNEFEFKIKRIENEIKGIAPQLTENISLIQEFIPSINIDRLQEVESFHKKISFNVKKQLKEELLECRIKMENIITEIQTLEMNISKLLNSKGLPNDLFDRVFDLKEATDKAFIENVYYEKKEDLVESIKEARIELQEVYSSIFNYIEKKINFNLYKFNKVVYGPHRKSSKLTIKKEDSFNFSSESDTGTGKSYAGLVGFDIAILACTHLPIIIHDSIIYKNIEVEAVKNILRILSAIKTKQIFLAFDEAPKYGSYTEKLIRKNMVLELGDDKLLYSRDWRKV